MHCHASVRACSHCVCCQMSAYHILHIHLSNMLHVLFLLYHPAEVPSSDSLRMHLALAGTHSSLTLNRSQAMQARLRMLVLEMADTTVWMFPCKREWMMKATGSCLSPSCRRSVVLNLTLPLLTGLKYLPMFCDLSSANNPAVSGRLHAHVMSAKCIMHWVWLCLCLLTQSAYWCSMLAMSLTKLLCTTSCMPLICQQQQNERT